MLAYPCEVIPALLWHSVLVSVTRLSVTMMSVTVDVKIRHALLPDHPLSASSKVVVVVVVVVVGCPLPSHLNFLLDF